MTRTTQFIVLAAVLSLQEGAAAAPDEPQFDAAPVVNLLNLVLDSNAAVAKRCLGILADKTQSGEISGQQAQQLKKELDAKFQEVLNDPQHDLHLNIAALAASWHDERARDLCRAIATDVKRTFQDRLIAFNGLVTIDDPQAVSIAAAALLKTQKTIEFQAGILSALARMESPSVASVVISRYSRLSDELRPRAIELLTQRPAWSKKLLGAIGRKEIPQTALNANQVTRLVASRDAELVALVKAKWGSVRSERDPKREAVLKEMQGLLERTAGDAEKGEIVFHRVCGQCHTIYGKGAQVGPDLTANGRNSYAQLLSNVFDPSLVIGAAYQARTVRTDAGRVLTGLVVEDSPQRLVLKLQGGKTEALPRDEIEPLQVSKLSMMPEGLEGQLKPQEIADLFAFLVLDRPPQDPRGKRIPGSPSVGR